MIAAFIRLLVGAQARWVGCSPDNRQRIYFANHGSNLDGPTIWSCLPASVRRQTRIIAAKDYWDANPWRRYIAKRLFNALLVNRRRVTRDDNPLEQMKEACEKEQVSLIIFPEGSRKDMDDGDALLPFKTGLFRLAQLFPNMELVPVYVRNLNRILPKGEYLAVPLLSSVSFGRPIVLNPDEDKFAFAKRAQRAILDLVQTEDR